MRIWKRRQSIPAETWRGVARRGVKKRKRKKKVYIPTTAKAESQCAGPAGDYSAPPPQFRARPTPRLNPNLLARCSGRGRDPGRLRRTRAVCWLWKRAEDNNNLLNLPLRRRRSQLHFFVKLCYWLKNTSMKSWELRVRGVDVSVCGRKAEAERRGARGGSKIK